MIFKSYLRTPFAQTEFEWIIFARGVLTKVYSLDYNEHNNSLDI